MKEREKLHRDLLRIAAEVQNRVVEVVDSEHFEFIVLTADKAGSTIFLVQKVCIDVILKPFSLFTATSSGQINALFLFCIL